MIITENGCWINKRKRQAIHYILYKFLEWWEKNGNNKTENDISTLKFLHLVYQVSVIWGNRNEKYYLIDNVFNNFYAQPYGIIEEDVEKYITSSGLTTAKTAKLIAKPIIDNDLKYHIDNSINELYRINRSLINYSSFDFIEMSQRTYTWGSTYNIAKKLKTFSQKINLTLLKNETHIFEKPTKYF